MDASPLIGTRTGVGVFVAELTSRLADRALARGQEVELVEYTLSLAAKRSGTVRGRWVPIPGGLAPSVWRFGRGPRIELFTGPLDVVHGTNYLVPPARAKRIVSVYDLSYVHDRATVPRNVARFDAAVRWAIRGGATVHTMSEFVGAEIRDRYQTTDVVVVPGGVAVREPLSVDPVGPPVVLALGMTGRRKRIPVLVEAFGLIADRTDVVLRIVGPAGDDEPAVQAAIASLGARAGRRVERVGVVDDATRDRELSRATVLAFPSEYEGFGFPVLEAMATGTAVVTTSAGSLSEVAGEAAVIVPVGDVEALGAALAAVVSDVGRQRELVIAGLERARTFSWDRTVDAMIDLYDTGAE